jgi:hypothetical protein
MLTLDDFYDDRKDLADMFQVLTRALDIVSITGKFLELTVAHLDTLLPLPIICAHLFIPIRRRKGQFR